MNVVELKDVCKTYPTFRLNNVSLSLEKGKITGFIGRNGAGKTTTFYMIIGLEHPNAGEVFIGNREVSGLPMHQRAAMGVSYLAQEA